VELTLNEAQHSARLAVYMTDTIVVRLTEDPGGLYRWRLSSADPATLEMIDQRYEPAHTDGGASGASVWTFKPRKTGRTRLALAKLRPWQGGDAPADEFAVDLDIR
jgi:predicted secreted protein